MGIIDRSKSGFATDTSTATTSSRRMDPAKAFSVAVCSRATSRSHPTRRSPTPDAVRAGGLGAADVLLATDKRRAFQVYSTRYLETSGQIYWADSQLSAAYVDDYHADLDRALGAAAAGE